MYQIFSFVTLLQYCSRVISVAFGGITEDSTEHAEKNLPFK